MSESDEEFKARVVALLDTSRAPSAEELFPQATVTRPAPGVVCIAGEVDDVHRKWAEQYRQVGEWWEYGAAGKD